MADFINISKQVKNLANSCGASIDARKPKANFRPYTEKKKDSLGKGYLAITREDQLLSSVYSGLSLVMFPIANTKDTDKILTIICLCVGTGNLGEDTDLANQPYARRLFTSLKYDDSDSFKGFFVKNDFADVNSFNDSLFKKIDELLEDKEKYDDEPYLLDVREDYGKYIQAAVLVELNEDDLKNWTEKDSKDTRNLSASAKIIAAWMALYSLLRNWKTRDDKFIKKLITYLKAPQKTFEESYVEVNNLLKKEKFIVLQGAPGAGKTFMANKIANESDLRFAKTFLIQFHAETSYVDFIGGIKPVLEGSTDNDLKFKYEEGILTQAILEAKKNTQKNYLLIIDEINRANLANVLGETFYLFEKGEIRDNESKETRTKIRIKVSGNSDEKSYIEESVLPSNLYVLATMNTADKSIATVDFALRRRFLWYYVNPMEPNLVDEEGDILILKEENDKYFLKKDFETINQLFEKYASDDELDLQPGQSYFIISQNEMEDPTTRKNLWKYKLMPLMKEYFAAGFLKDMKDEFANYYYEIVEENMYR